MKENVSSEENAKKQENMFGTVFCDETGTPYTLKEAKNHLLSLPVEEQKRVGFYRYVSPYTNIPVLLRFRKGKYVKFGGLAIQAECFEPDGWWEPYCMVTVNLTGVASPQAFLNTNNSPEMKRLLCDVLNVAKDTGYQQQSGYCKYPLVEFSEEFLEKLGDIE